jgi:hypothetical protein
MSDPQTEASACPCPVQCEAVTDQNEQCPSKNARWRREGHPVCGRHQFASHGFIEDGAQS